VIAVTAVVSIAVFIGALWMFGVVRLGYGVLASTKDAVAVMVDESLDDAVREKAVRRAALQLLGVFMSILLRSALAFAASILPIWLAVLAGLVKTDEVFRYLARWDVILISSIVITIIYYLWIQTTSK
jgi:hypothetical protein